MNNENIVGQLYVAGTRGYSAYEVAVQNGFVGTEEEWLESLVGPQGYSAYEVAVQNGFVGTEDEWLESLIGPQGEKGKSAYEVAVDNGYEGTEEEWVNSFLTPDGYVQKQDIIDNLESTEVEKVLSANQGRILKNLIDENATGIEETNDNITAMESSLLSSINSEISNRQSADSNLQSQISSLASGAPSVVSSTSEMIDTDKIYVNTTNGHWYYHDGNSWVDAGVYQATGLENDSVGLNNLKKSILGVKYHVWKNGNNSRAKFTIPNSILSTSITKIRARFKMETIGFEDNPYFSVFAENESESVYQNYVFFQEKVKSWIPNNNEIKDVDITANVNVTQTVFDAKVVTLGLSGTTNATEFYLYDPEIWINDTKLDLTFKAYELEHAYGRDLTESLEKDYIASKQYVKEKITESENNLIGVINNKHLSDDEVIFDNLSEVIRNCFKLDIKDSEEVELTWTEGKFYSNETGELVDNASTKSSVVNVNPGEIYFAYGVKWGSLYPALLCNDTEVLNYWGEPSYQTFLIKIPYGANNLKINSRVYTGVTVTKLYKLNSITISDDIKNEIVSEAKGFGFNRWFAIGDSITTHTYRASKNYVDYIEEDLGITCVNLGVSSSGYKQPSVETFAERIQHITDYDLNNDIITVMGGINDRGYSSPQYLGSLGDTTMDTFYGSVYVFFNTLFTAYPGCRVGLIEPTPANIEPDAYPNLIKALNETAELFNVPVLHLHSTSNLRPNEETFRNLYFKADGEGAEERGYPVDGIHPNSLGYKIFTNRIKEFIKNL